MRTRAVLTLAVFSLVLFVNRAARADSFAWFVPAGGNVQQDPVAGMINISISQNNYIDIQVVNFEDNPHSIGQVITGLDLALTAAGKTALSNISLSSNGAYQQGVLRTICASNGDGCSAGQQAGDYSDSDPSLNDLNWQSNAGTNMFKGDLALCAGGCGTWSPDGIIGRPDQANGLYDNFPDSSLSSGIHAPEAFGDSLHPVTFHIYAAGVTATTSVSSLVSGATFLFGTSGTPIQGTPGTPPPPPGFTPEPSALLLMLPGVFGVAARYRRRIRA